MAVRNDARDCNAVMDGVDVEDCEEEGEEAEEEEEEEVEKRRSGGSAIVWLNEYRKKGNSDNAHFSGGIVVFGWLITTAW